MSWSLFLMPLHGPDRDGMAEWLASLGVERGGPEAVRDLPVAAQVLDALRAAGCRGTNWFQVVGEPAGTRLPEGPRSADGLDLGEVNLHVTGSGRLDEPVEADATVEAVSFRKPEGLAALTAACVLAALGGPQVVFDTSGSDTVVVWPGDTASSRRTDWPWLI